MKSALLSLLLTLPAAAAPLGYGDYAKQHERLMEGATAKKLEDALPGLSADIKAAQGVSARYWTDCTVFDELAKADILSEKAMKGLGIRRETTKGVVHASAGVMHTYGYVFSQLQTSFGLKGKRWIESRIDERLGLPAAAFSVRPAEGEFVANLTSVLLTLAGAPEKVKGAAKLEPKTAALGSVVETVVWKTPSGKTVPDEIRTILVPLADVAGLTTTDKYLLIYETVRDGRHRLTTAFPIAQGFADSFTGAKAGPIAAFKPRFNLYVPPDWTVASARSEGWKAAK